MQRGCLGTVWSSMDHLRAKDMVIRSLDFVQHVQGIHGIFDDTPDLWFHFLFDSEKFEKIHVLFNDSEKIICVCIVWILDKRFDDRLLDRLQMWKLNLNQRGILRNRALVRFLSHRLFSFLPHSERWLAWQAT